MLKNYFLVSIRNLLKQKLFSAINILSLTLGIVACQAIYLFVTDERSFDGFHTKKEQLYRLNEVQSFPGTNTQKVALSMPGMGPNLLNDFEEIESYTRFWSMGARLFENGQTREMIQRPFRVDSTFLDLFDFELLQGDRQSCLDAPNSILLTQETAELIFADNNNIIDQQITIDGDTYQVTGILSNVPENSHLQFDALVSISSVFADRPEFNDTWGSNFLNTYLLVSPNADLEAMAERYPDFLVNRSGSEDANDYYKLYLQSLQDVHLASTDVEHDYNNYRKFNGSYLGVFTLVGIFVALIAGVNFMNLTVARSSYRWKEVGVRKAIGARKPQLFAQFMLESLIMVTLALGLGFALSFVLIPVLNNLIGRQLEFMNLLAPAALISVCGGALFLGLLAGSYPALHLASFKVVRILKGIKMSGKNSLLGNGLIVLQFGLAIAMIVGTVVVVQQLMFMKNKDIGFDKEQIVLIDMNQTANDQFDALKTEYLRNSGVVGVTASGQRLGNNFHQWGFKVRMDTAVVDITPSNVFVDYDYFEVYGIDILEGRGFSKDYSTDNGMAFVINQALADEIGVDEIVGMEAGHGWYSNDTLGTIIGVTPNFNFNSLHYSVNTLAMVVHEDWGYNEMSVKLKADNVQETLAQLRTEWEAQVPDWPFQYSFLDDHFAELYRSDDQMSAVVSIVAGVAIMIACMGLFGLAAITAEKRLKELGIRKTLGASVGQLVFATSKSFGLLVLVAFVLFAPLAGYALSVWLENFAFRVDLNLWQFLIAGLAAMALAVTTVSYHALKAARANPSDTLKYE